MSSATYHHAAKPERDPDTYQLEQVRTAGGHVASSDQPSMPVVHRNFANPAPLGLLSFATGIFLISILGVHARGIQTPNILVGVIIFFGGVCQFIAGIMEFIAGNSFGATVFPSYAAFNFSYAMIYLPGTGILAAYIDADTGLPTADFNNALGMFCWAWFILTVIFTVAAMRSSWALFLTLFFLDIELLLLAVGYMLSSNPTLVAANSVGFLVAFCSCELALFCSLLPSPSQLTGTSWTDWAGCAGLYSGGLTPFTLPTFPMYQSV
jgi:succinate-acetate transporter protein